MSDENSKSALWGRISFFITFIGALFTLIGGLWGGYAWYTSECDSYNLTGQWKFVFSIEQSSMKSYIGMSAGYRIFIDQNKKSVHGVGEKWWVNNAKIPYAQHDKLEFNGTIKDGILTATYTLYGKVATTSGGFKGKIKNDNKLGGEYAGTAADTKGSFIADKE